MYKIEDLTNKIFCADCLEFIREIPDKSIDLVLTDPPYGINMDKGTNRFGCVAGRKYEDNWDKNRPTKNYFDEMSRMSKKMIIFGGNFFTDLLPVGTHWIVWDKIGEIKFKNPFSDCELVWTNIGKKSIRKYIVIQQGFVAKEKTRYHPTQKPVELIKKILLDYSNKDDIVLDCFLGSGTTCVACAELGRRYIGIEISEKYVDIARKRVKIVENQGKLF